MIQKIRNCLLIALGLAVLLAPAAPVVAMAPQFASTKADLCNGIEAASGSSSCGSSGSISNLLTTIVNIISLVIGVVAVIMILVAGFKFMTSGGESSKVAEAKNSLIYAIVGIVVVALAQIIIRYVVNRSIGAVGS